MKRQTILAALLVLLASAAQAATVRGKVTYADGKPCAGAAVTVINGSNQSSTEAYSDSQGMYYLPDVPPGRYTLNVKTSRGTKSVPITVAAAEYSDAPAVTVN